MTIINFIKEFPEISRKDEKYSLYLGLVAGLTADQTAEILELCLEQNLIKRKTVLNHIMFSAGKWTARENNEIFKKVFKLKNTLSSYYKKESASMILMMLFPLVSRNNQQKLSEDFSQSRYKNNRRRIYKHFYKNWSSNCESIIEEAWASFKDEESIRIIVAKMPKEYLLANLNNLLPYFDEKNLSYDFFRKILRNQLYLRLFEDIPSKIEELKVTDPISYIYINKAQGKKIDITGAIQIYKQNANTRYLARWYSEMKLWDDILKMNPKFLSEIEHK